MSEIGHNSELTPEQRQALFFQHMAKVKRQKEKVATATGELRAMYKVAKADGIPKKRIEYALTLDAADEEKMEALIEDRRREDEIARWLGTPVGTQLDLEFHSVNANDAAGFRDGSMGLEADGADLAGEAHQSYMRGYYRGVEAANDARAKISRDEIAEGAELLGNVAAGVARASGEKRRRGRPRKNADGAAAA